MDTRRIRPDCPRAGTLCEHGRNIPCAPRSAGGRISAGSGETLDEGQVVLTTLSAAMPSMAGRRRVLSRLLVAFPGPAADRFLNACGIFTSVPVALKRTAELAVSRCTTFRVEAEWYALRLVVRRAVVS